MNHRRIAAIVLLLATAGSPACGTDDGKAPNAGATTSSSAGTKPTATSAADPTTTALSPTTVTTQAEDAHPAVAAALGFWTRYIEMTGRPGPFDPIAIRAELDEFTTGAETAKLFEFIQGNMLTGRVLRGTVEHSPRLDAVAADVATVIDCLVDGTGIYSTDGRRSDAEDLRPHPATLGLRLVDGVWKVETVSIGAETCAP